LYRLQERKTFARKNHFLAVGLKGVVAITAIYGPSLTGFKRHLRTFTALSTSGRERLPFSAEPGLNIAIVPSTDLACFSGLTAGWAALGGIIIAFCFVGFLFFYSEDEICATIKAGDSFFFQAHLDDLLISII
jgi:hypothetical protein